MPKKLRPKIGTHVTGTGYWPGARPDPDIVVARLEGGESVKSFGLRRIGKSSLLYETARRLKGHHRPVIQLDGQQIHSIPTLLKEIIAALPREKGPVHRLIDWTRTIGLPPEVKSKLEALIIEKIVGSSEPALDAYAELLFKELGAAFAVLPPPQRPVLFIDELPWFCDNVLMATPTAERPAATARLNSLLAVLRAWRSEDVGVAMALSGSLSMAWLQREHGVQSDHLNDCLPVQVEELSLDQAVRMVRAMTAYVSPPDWYDGVAECLCDRLPALFPGVVQVAFAVIRFEPTLNPDRLRSLIREQIADALEENYYNQFERRMTRYAAAERTAAYGLLAAILAADDGTVGWQQAETMCGASGRVLLERLMDDGLIRASRTRGVRFASGLAFHWFRGRE